MGVRCDEGDVVKGCLEYLALVGVWAWRQNQGAIPLPSGKGFRRFAGLKGVSDILGVLELEGYTWGPSDAEPMLAHTPFGVLLAVECKKPGGKVRKEQAEFLDNVRRRGGVALLVESVKDLQDGLAPYLRAGRKAA